MMSKERELLARVLTSELWSVQEELQAEIKELLAQPEQNKAEAIMPNGVCVSNVYDAYKEGKKSVMVEQEPVAWMWEENTSDGWVESADTDKPPENEYRRNIQPLYLAPPKRKPLSDDEMRAIWKEGIRCEIPFVEIGRAIEKAHGIGGGE